MKKIIEFDQKCQSCEGTGLYSGMGERNNAAVVCSSCQGTGISHFKHTYEEPEPRSRKKGIITVHKTNPGIGVNADRKQFGGMSYEDWLAGEPFPPKSENRNYTCPAWWYQSADYKKKPNWKECGCGSFSNCLSFKIKNKCWERWDKENG